MFDTKDTLHILDLLNTEYSRYVAKLVLSKSMEDLKRVSPMKYTNPDLYLRDAQAYALVAKNFCLPKRDTQAIALKNFLASEAVCSKTNDRFKKRDFSFLERSLLERARQFCRLILNDRCYISEPDFGPGVTLELGGKHCNIITKLSTLPEVTPLAYELVTRTILETMPQYAISSGMVIRERAHVELGPRLAYIHKGSRFATVPKTYETDRPICIEPSGNMLLQKGVGRSIRNQLKKFGYDLNSAPALHEQLACRGSIDGTYATIDLSSASDTISKEFVRFLLPVDWYETLDTLRSHCCLIRDQWIYLEKFSSMGNGFTFELESCLFLSLALACRDHLKLNHTRLSVFGDDIICHPRVAWLLWDLLECAGFSINRNKTFLFGNFRESCGCDFLNGVAVRPVFLKDYSEEHHVVRLYYLLNRLSDIAYRLNFTFGRDARFRNLWKKLLHLIPGHLRHYGPEGHGDSVIHCNERRYNSRIRVLTKRSRYFKIPTDANKALACALYGVPSFGVVPRNCKYTVSSLWLPTAHVECRNLGWT